MKSDTHQKIDEKYRELFNRSKDANLIIHNGIFADCNQATIDLLKYNNKTDILNMNPAELSPKKQPDGKMSFSKANDMIEIALKNGNHRFEWYHKKSDGEIFPVDVSLTALSNTENDHILYASLRDITARKQLEIELKESENKYRKLIETTADGFWLNNSKNITTLVNQSLCKMLGYSENEIIGKSPMDFIDIENKKILKKQILESKSTSHRTYEILLTRKNGTVFPALFRATSIVDKNEKLEGSFVFITDITELKQAEKNIEKLSSAIKQSPSVVVITDLMGNLEYVNPKFTELTGYTSEEAMGQNPRILKFGEIPDKIYKELWDSISSGKEWHGEFHNKKKNGELFWEAASISPIFDKQGKITNYLKVAEDITKRKRIEKKLIESEEKFRLLTTNTSDTIWTTDLEFNLAYVNEAIYSFLGYTQEEFIGLNFSKFTTPESLQKIEEMAKDVVSNSRPNKIRHSQIEVQQIRKDGQIIDVEISANAIFDQDGNIIGFQGRSIDISNRKKMRETLMENEEKYRLIVDNAHDGIEITQNDKIIFSNARFAEMLGYTIDELENIPFYQIYSNSATRKLKERANRRKAGKSVPHQYETTFIKKDKTAINVEVKYEIIDYKGNPATFAIIHDITERKLSEIMIKENSIKLEKEFHKSEKQRIANLVVLNDLNKTTKELHLEINEHKKTETKIKAAFEKATESDRLKSAFLANMSHEIRTPMNGILGFTELLKKPQLSGEEQAKYISIIEKSGNRLLNTINDLMDISKIEANQMNVDISKININNKMKDLYNFFKPQFDEKGIRLSFTNALSIEKVNINTDNEKLYAILTNLIKNAFKYTHKGNIEFGYNKKDNDLEFYVKDTGIGISTDRQGAIFDRFIQADIEDKNVYEGSGLGLSISKAYVEMLGGKIRVESEKGIGSQFYFTIPYNADTEDISEGKEKPEVTVEHSDKKLKILIVEDEETADMYLSIVLENIGKEILHAKTGIEAIDICRNDPDIDLIMMDIRMPKMDGYEATRKIREFYKNVIIIAQTAYALEGDRNKSLEAGCDDHIVKPIDRVLLTELIKTHCKEC